MGLGLSEAPLLPIPDAALSAGDRQHFLDAYSGIAFTTPPTGGAISAFQNTAVPQIAWVPRPHDAGAWSFSLLKERFSELLSRRRLAT